MLQAFTTNGFVGLFLSSFAFLLKMKIASNEFIRIECYHHKITKLAFEQ